MQILLVGQHALFPKRCRSTDQLLMAYYLGCRIIGIDTVVGLLEHNVRVLQKVLSNDEQLQTAIDGARVE